MSRAIFWPARRDRNKLLYKEEKDFLGCDHAQLGRQLMKQWKLPLILENNVLYHHNLQRHGNHVPATIVHLADIIVNSLGIGSSGEKFIPPLDYNAWENLELSPSSFETIIGQAIHQFQGTEINTACLENMMNRNIKMDPENLQARIEYLEENGRLIQNALEMALSLGDFQENINKGYDARIYPAGSRKKNTIFDPI